MSRSNNPWLQFHQPATVQTWSGDTATDATTVATSSPNPGPSSQLNRVTRPTIARRRSRASRKTPITLLNTDTTNFRAMVQRFTGGGNSGGDVPVTSAHQVLNTNYNSTSYSGYSGFGDRVGSGAALHGNESYNQLMMMMTGDYSGNNAGHDDDVHQHMT